MSSFSVRVVPVEIAIHPNADALELAKVGDYLSIVRKGAFQNGDLVAYIPEQAIVPAPILDELGLTGRLAGRDANRVKAIKLRGILSQGICLPARPGWVAGQDVTEALGVTKYEPPIPVAMAGEVYAAGLDRTLRYDIENVKAYPDVLQDGEPVVFTEKIHGTWCQIGLVPEDPTTTDGGVLVVSSKGLAAKGLAFKLDAPANADNLYLRAARALGARERIAAAFPSAGGSPVFVLGEVFGRGVQDLAYGASAERDEGIGFRVFDVYVGVPGRGRYLSDADLDAACARLGWPRVPVLYRGPFSKAALLAHTDGKESVSGKGAHIREGLVVRPQAERRDDRVGRVQFKSVSERYLLRDGGTEFQ